MLNDDEFSLTTLLRLFSELHAVLLLATFNYTLLQTLGRICRDVLLMFRKCSVEF